MALTDSHVLEAFLKLFFTFLNDSFKIEKKKAAQPDEKGISSPGKWQEEPTALLHLDK